MIFAANLSSRGYSYSLADVAEPVYRKRNCSLSKGLKTCKKYIHLGKWFRFKGQRFSYVS